MPSAVDRRYMERVTKPVEAERAGQRNGVAAINQPVAETAFAFCEMVEMDARGILIKSRCDLCSASSTVMPST